mmetsp:Transcript_74077/g.187891  ORF Transcript_74077/g.187891 Transcript_74077/m.187891 type:complete len:303 (-) Transcript_74077:354-1262(-)
MPARQNDGEERQEGSPRRVLAQRPRAKSHLRRSRARTRGRCEVAGLVPELRGAARARQRELQDHRREQPHEGPRAHGRGALQPPGLRLVGLVAQPVCRRHANPAGGPDGGLRQRQERARECQDRHRRAREGRLCGQDGLREVHDLALHPSDLGAQGRQDRDRRPRHQEDRPELPSVHRRPGAPGPDGLRRQLALQHRSLQRVPGWQDLGGAAVRAAAPVHPLVARRNRFRDHPGRRQHQLRPEAAPELGSHGDPAATSAAVGRVHLGAGPEHAAGRAEHAAERLPDDHGHRDRTPCRDDLGF